MGKVDTYISYEEAQKLIPIFQYAKKFGPHRELRLMAGRILEELELVRGDIDYSPLRGDQVFLSRKDTELLLDALEYIRGKEGI